MNEGKASENLTSREKLIAQINSFPDGQHIYSYKSNPGYELGNPNSSVAERPHSFFQYPSMLGPFLCIKVVNDLYLLYFRLK